MMKDELDSGLVKQFPKMFKERYQSMTTTCMCWGFEHGDGWYDIIKNICHLIQSHIDWSRKNRAQALRFNRALRRAIAGDSQDLEYFYAPRDYQTRVKKLGVISEWSRTQMAEEIAEARFRPVPGACSQVVVEQVKEKFGTLRFYYRGGDDYVDGVVRMGEAMTAVTCETCGAPGRQRGGGWIVTLCDEHAEKRDIVCDEQF
jgi:hypothetical protein